MSQTSDIVPRRIAQLVDRLTRLSRDLQFCEGLNPAQWEALRFLARANRYSRSPSALAAFLGTTRGTASQTLIALENRGLITRRRGTGDGRTRALDLTPEGEALLCRDPILAVEEAAKDLPQEIEIALVRGLSRLAHELESRAGAKTFGVCRDCSLLCLAAVKMNATEAIVPRCGLTGDHLNDSDQARICIDFHRANA
jgi:DNA-binding MarR family transcriptional regulator